jgi:hypothetical protein
VEKPPLSWRPRPHGRRRLGLEAVEPPLAELDHQQVGDDHPGEHREKGCRKRREAERVRERRERQRDAHGDDQERRDRERPARPVAEELHAPRADREEHDALSGERLDEPAGAEERRAGVEHAEHHAEGGEVEDRADRPEEEHEAPDQAHVPVARPPQLLLLDAVGGDSSSR